MTSNGTVAVSGMMWLHDQQSRMESGHGTAEERSGPERGGDHHLGRLARNPEAHRAMLRALGTAPAGTSLRRYVATSRDCSASSSARTVGNWPSTLERRTPYGMQRLLAYQSMVAQNHLYLWSA